MACRMRVLAVVIPVMFAAGVSRADLWLYTFEGTIEPIRVDDVKAVETAGLEAGDPVTYVFAVDFHADGTELLSGGVTSTLVDDYGFEYFYTDLISGRYLSAVDGGDPTWPLEYNYGYTQSTYSEFRGGESGTMVLIATSDAIASTWYIGQTGFYAKEEATCSTCGVTSYIEASLTLVDIKPVPLPGAVLLGSIGLGMSGWLCRRRRQ